MTANQEEKVVTLLRNGAIGARLSEVFHERLVETRSGEEFWSVVRSLSQALGVPGMCLMLNGRLFELGARGAGGEVVGISVPRGRLLVRVDGGAQKASLAVVWMVRRALLHGAGAAPAERSNLA